jgi:two-component system phosphate regulon response regulator PhoB
MTVLLVDDDDDLREALAEALEADGVHVMQASNAHAALDALHARRPRAVLLDIMMPDMNGEDLYRAMQADDPDLAGVPVLRMTAQSSAPSLSHLRFLRKPMEARDVAAALRAAAGPVF